MFSLAKGVNDKLLNDFESNGIKDNTYKIFSILDRLENEYSVPGEILDTLVYEITYQGYFYGNIYGGFENPKRFTKSFAESYVPWDKIKPKF